MRVSSEEERVILWTGAPPYYTAGPAVHYK